MKLSLTILAIILSFSTTSEAFSGLHHTTLNTPVLLLSDTDSAGSGVYISKNSKLYFVTAKHVIFDNTSSLKANNITLLSYVGNEPKQQMKYFVDLPAAKKANNIYIPTSKDIAIIKILNQRINQLSGKTESFLTKGVTCDESYLPVMAVDSSNNVLQYKEVKVSSEVFLLGYPISLGTDKENKYLIDFYKPLLRKGIVAGKNELNRTIIIDCPVYKGNSGGPVFEIDREDDGVDRTKLFGIVTDFIPLVEKLKSSLYDYENVNLTNSGYGVVVPLDDILSYIDKI